MTQAGQSPPSWAKGQTQKGAYASRGLWGLIGTLEKGFFCQIKRCPGHGVLGSRTRVLDLKPRPKGQQSPDNPQSWDPQA